MAHSQRRSVGDRAQFLFWFPYIYLLDRHSTHMYYSRTVHKSQISKFDCTLLSPNGMAHDF